jgi:thymidine phosphorylase
VDALEDLEVAAGAEVVRAPRAGVVRALDAQRVGVAVARLGGGRQHKGDRIDLAVGAEIHARVGDPVSAGEAILTLRHRSGRGLDGALAALAGAIEIADEATRPPLVLGRIEGSATSDEGPSVA